MFHHWLLIIGETMVIAARLPHLIDQCSGLKKRTNTKPKSPC